MIQRIRYKQTDPNVYETTSFFPSLKGNVKVVIDIDTEDFSLINIETQEVVINGSGKGLTKLKAKAKKALLEAGVVFQTETRVRLRKVMEELKIQGINV